MPFLHGRTETQAHPCKARNLCSSFKKLPKCFVCEGRGLGCRFIGNRTITYSHTLENRISFKFKEGPNPHFPTVFNREMNTRDVELKMAAAARALHPILVAEVSFQKHPDLIRRKREVEWRVTCDLCMTELFSGSWLCATCGREICSECATSPGQPNSFAIPCSSGNTQHCLVPVTRFDQKELEDAIEGMERVLQKEEPVVAQANMPSNPGQPFSESTQTREVPTFRQGHVTFSEFQRHWSQGVPVVITNVRMQGDWSPEYFIARYGSKDVTIVDCETEATLPGTVADFFLQFGQRVRILKIKDWPPQKDFRAEFAELDEGFSLASPFPDMTRPNGTLNCASHFPENGIVPDLGPKMYNADGSIHDDRHHGSTKLHLDVTDALNIMAWAADVSDGKPGYSIWDLFSAADTPNIRLFLREEGFLGPGDAVHSQCIYLGPKMLERLAAKYNVRPFRVIQSSGDAIFIPAGCSHQVCNFSSAIKIARDYISIDNLAHTQRLVGEFREQRLATGKGDDVLQLYTTLWYMWVSLTQQTFTIWDPPSSSLAADHEPGDKDVSPLALAKRDKRKESRMRQRLALSQLPGHPFLCFFCSRKFHRGGLIDHLQSSHSERFCIDRSTDKAIRQPTKYTDDEYLRIMRGCCLGLESADVDAA